MERGEKGEVSLSRALTCSEWVNMQMGSAPAQWEEVGQLKKWGSFLKIHWSTVSFYTLNCNPTIYSIVRDYLNSM